MNVSAVNSSPQYLQSSSFIQSYHSLEVNVSYYSQDVVSIGGEGPLSTEDAIRVVNERALSKLTALIEQAKAELGLPEGAVLDTSAEATAGRIADFALGAFERWLDNHELEDTSDSRQAFVEFIGGAVQQGIDEATEILNALQALTPETTDLIESITGFIQQRFDAFLAGAPGNQQAA